MKSASRNRKAVQAVEELLLTQNTVDLVFSIINGFVYFPDYPLWDIFISHDALPLEMNPQPVNMEHTLQWLEKQVMPSVAMLAEIDRLTGSSYLKEIDAQTTLTDTHEKKIQQMCTDVREVIEDKGCSMRVVNAMIFPYGRNTPLPLKKRQDISALGKTS
ncbi:MAG: replication initiation factor domain-containing protein [Agathobacter rectalis]